MRESIVAHLGVSLSVSPTPFVEPSRFPITATSVEILLIGCVSLRAPLSFVDSHILSTHKRCGFFFPDSFF